jgi:hypothetical protein
MTTHSPSIVTSANLKSLHIVRKDGSSSTIQAVDIKETENLRQYLTEIGARLSDVFGSDDILWVEGKTEEECFPLILEHSNVPLLGTAVLAVRSPGDLQKKDPKQIYDIYTKLCTGRGILPPAISFIFDRESTTQRRRDDLSRQSEGRVHFLKRRMYENYLLNPRAIVAVASGLEGFRDSSLTLEEVDDWFCRRGYEPSEEVWKVDVHGARLLEQLFKEFSGGTYPYDKVVHGTALTRWLLDHSPEQLAEVRELLEQVLDADKRRLVK